ncbi:LamG-like jellyroll fold domain-containing protein [Sphingomonas sp. NFR15]|uniref:LamG-like jellyroll fold domain-containing protein n=1 Tax=Sphingomonas sp. NFR15 TaxID=1566282 RepID=UPI00087FC3E4|nr:LamG-like jellyroll fold domain-containing protein [Sphingomonas sp. NFR15]SDA28330.1 Concanavalin A-like lectin/glucanases superfamily protein [Sphingomonas sp. NFR15]
MKAPRFRVFLAATTCLAAPAFAQAPARDDAGLLFALSGETGATAERAVGLATPIFADGVKTVADGRVGQALSLADQLALAWSAPGNIIAQRGTLSFFFRPRTPLGTTPFPLFRIGDSDGTSWDMAWGRIDWNGHGFDAFVTDTGLARTRVSFKIDSVPSPTTWIHVAFAWDETTGVKLWIDGKPVAQANRKAVYDGGLFGFGPFQRIVSPYQVQSQYNYIRSGDMDEIRIYDHRLDDAQVAALAAAQAPAVPAAPPRSLADATTRDEWWLRYGWTRTAPDYLASPETRIRKVEFVDTRDQKERMFRGADGIRETTWPGVYNRSRLPGRHDYFELPDWNVYSTGGKTYTLTLPDEPWNRIEINGPAYGTLSDLGGTLLTRPAGLERTSTALARERRGGTLRFENIAQETPIEEIGAYDVTAGAVPDDPVVMSYTLDAKADPASYPALDTLRRTIAGRYTADERATIVALPAGAPRKPAAAPAPRGLPLVHILIPGDFRDSRPGGAISRFAYGTENMNVGLDGLAIDLPALDVQPTHGGLLPLNIRVKDPTWPDRDLLDINVSVKPHEARTLWLDTRDRILPPGASLYVTIAAAGGGFDAAKLDGTRVRLLYKPAVAAKPEHVADRFEQARDNLAFLVEEQPNTRAYPVWDRFERDISDVLRVDPDNAVARAYWVEKNPNQPYAAFTQPTPPAGVPLWASRQSEDLKLYRRFVDWWIDNRQIADGEFGGGLSDDTDLVNQWVPLALMGVEPARLAASQRRVLDATYANGMWSDGLSRIRADELHSYEEGINSVAQSLQLSPGDPTAIERAMAVARNYPRLIAANPAGHHHIVSSYYSGTDIVREGVWGWQRPYSLLITHPGLLLADYNGAPAVKAALLPLLDDWLAHGKQAPDGSWTYPSEIEWATDATRGTGVVSAANVFWAAWTWTHDGRYLRPITADLTHHNLAALSRLNPDLLTRLPGGPALVQQIAAGTVTAAGVDNDRNLGGSTDADFARFVRWQSTGDKTILADLFGAEIESDSQRMHLLTEGHFWSDRVSVPIELLQRTRLGGVAHRRNAYAPGNLVRWQFGPAATAEDVALLIPAGDPRHFKVIAYNLTDRPITATMIGDGVAAGRWSMTGGIDANDDDHADVPSAATPIGLEQGASVALALPPRQTSVFEFTLAAAGEEPRTRTDIGLSADDLAVRGAGLIATIHSLGAKPTPAGTATLTDQAGRAIATARFPALDAPSDLLPKTTSVRFALPRGATPETLSVTLTLDGTPAEISTTNNRARFGATIAGGSR